jgi:2-octaprenyl-6-methoxyphenol hydroxylase
MANVQWTFAPASARPWMAGQDAAPWKGYVTMDADVAIVGGGLVGASVAIGLAGTSLSVALIEPAPPPDAPARWDERCIAINHASRCILESFGVWPALAETAAPIRSTHISERGRFGVARFDAADADIDALGHNVPVARLGSLLWQRAQQTGCALYAPARMRDFRLDGQRVELTLDDDRRIAARLVVAADGMHSPLRERLGIGAQRRDYAQSAIVTAVRTTRAHRGCAYERFTPDGPIALLPKPWAQEDRSCSLVWTTPAAQLAARMTCDDAQFLALAQDAFGERLGRFTELGARQAWPLHRVVSAQLHAARVVLVGNAAQSLHPVAAQGFNLGLRDAAVLSELLSASGGDPGDTMLLERYAQQRAADRTRIADFTDGIVRLFSNRVPGLRGLRHLGLLALDLAPPLRDAVLWQNLGYAGHASAAARRRP